ncbi:penicillin-binding transpeptidase domain-containing protein [Streptacidiphilus jiangxiensis]|uniref:Penicillin binding protein transpeptidase domain-containing protein n=2 Tax=Streptacidiphilus jiangxiensis TaxID=235985 RepID=A0A1H7V4N1_STRJI|nr:penicillin-binding transpeptidase domain-containing protein [Streptacidiphilus jiangxiensis]SEM04019.1 Penicillin binding protein transpeptidase domain-containing protein [Streptacidiphilus jiangxiensis]
MQRDLDMPTWSGDDRASRRRSRKWLIASIAAVAVGGAGTVAALAYAHASQPAAKPAAHVPVVTQPTAVQAVAATQAFLASWAGADTTAAAQDTDQPTAAQPALQTYGLGLHTTAVSFTGVAAGTPDPAVADALRTSFKATAALGGGGSFDYTGTADVVVVDGKPLVHWAPSVLYPGLQSGQSLTYGSIPATTAKVEDRHGVVLTGKAYPSLAGVLHALQTRYAGKATRTPGRGVSITQEGGTATAKVLRVIHPAVSGTIRTTLDAGLQAAAERAVKDSHIGTMPSDVVAIDYTTGEIRAMAFRGGDAAFNGAAAPGSTMKMITSAALFDKAGLTPASSSPCVKSTVINGQTFHNFQNEMDPKADIAKDFAISCNTGFIDAATAHLHSGDLREEAQDVFGIGDWNIGVPTTDGNVPDEGGSTNQVAAQSIGQGRVTMNTLAMASVAATIADGAFHQPILVPGLAQQSAKRPITTATASALRQMMLLTATASYGTAEPRMTGINGGAKTGTAETATGTNGWFAAYDTANHLAVDALVIGGKEGVLSAGYVARDVLLAG